MSTITLKTPISDKQISGLHIGDVVYLDGLLITSRDDVHHRLLKQHRALPIDLAGLAIFHAGPIMRAAGEDGTKYEVISIGPTTSMRMESCEAEFIGQTGVKLIIGKGGMGAQTAAGCRKHKAIHCVFPGGCAVVAARRVEAVIGVKWLDLGMPEAMWVMKVKAFGPLIVSIDTEGRNLFEENRRLYDERARDIVDDICQHVNYIH